MCFGKVLVIMKIFGFNIGKAPTPTSGSLMREFVEEIKKRKPVSEAPMSKEMADFQLLMKNMLGESKLTISDNFKKMSEATGNYNGLEYLQKHMEAPLEDLKLVRDTIWDSTKERSSLKTMAKELGMPKQEVIELAKKIKKSTSHLVGVMETPNLTTERLKSIAKVFNERFKFLEKIKI